MIQYNPHLFGALMEDRERQIKKQTLLREIRSAKQEQKASMAARRAAPASEAKPRRKAVGATF